MPEARALQSTVEEPIERVETTIMVDFASTGVDDTTKSRILEFLNAVRTAVDIARASARATWKQ